jgi:TonB family protein
MASTEPADYARDSRPLQFSSLPTFPEMARKMNIRGAVQLEAVVRPDGTVKQVRVLGGHPLLAEIAARAVMQWRYKPEERETREVVKVNFRD